MSSSIDMTAVVTIFYALRQSGEGHCFAIAPNRFSPARRILKRMRPDEAMMVLRVGVTADPVDLPGALKPGAHTEQLGEERRLQNLGEIVHACRAAGAGLEADDALDRFQMAEAPELDVVFDIDELFGEFV
jgi:hypothetical protein